MKKRILLVMFALSLFLLATSRPRKDAAVFDKSEGWVVSATPANTLVSFHKPDGESKQTDITHVTLLRFRILGGGYKWICASSL